VGKQSEWVRAVPGQNCTHRQGGSWTTVSGGCARPWRSRRPRAVHPSCVRDSYPPPLVVVAGVCAHDRTVTRQCNREEQTWRSGGQSNPGSRSNPGCRSNFTDRPDSYARIFKRVFRANLCVLGLVVCAKHSFGLTGVDFPAEWWVEVQLFWKLPRTAKMGLCSADEFFHAVWCSLSSLAMEQGSALEGGC